MVLTLPVTEDLERPLPPLPPTAPERARDMAAAGTSAWAEGRYEDALKYYSALGTLENVAGAKYRSKLGIALVWRRLGEYLKALEVLEEALGLEDDRLVLLYMGVTLQQMGRYPEALDVFGQVKKQWPNDPDVWVYRMSSLVPLGRFQEALESAEQAFPLRHMTSDRGRLLYQLAGLTSGAFGRSALKRRWLPDLEAATKAFIQWRARARRDKQTAAFNQAVREFKKGLSEEEAESFEEFMLGVRLASIRNPFRRWEAIGKEISKVWPEGVSAVDAIREQRE